MFARSSVAVLIHYLFILLHNLLIKVFKYLLQNTSVRLRNAYPSVFHTDLGHFVVL